jgi:urea carboxylase
MLAKLIVYGVDRPDAIARMTAALAATRLSGIATNLEYLRQIVASPMFTAGDVSTRALSRFIYRPNTAEVLAPGTFTTIQDYPGRVGHWDVGVPPSGPMDDYAFRLANRIVGNEESAAGLECTLAGPTLKFHAQTVIALTGAAAEATLDGESVVWWAPVSVKAGQTLAVGRAISGCRTYLAVRGGFDVPVYLGSRSTFVLGQFGGHSGRTLRPGDMLPLGDARSDAPSGGQAPPSPALSYPSAWEVGVLYGPHGAPDFFTDEDIAMFFETAWQVHYNSNRLGIRLIGPKPSWTRSDGGEAGLHPSNIHDCEYAIGSVNFTGDMPIILTCDGPSLGGFVCPVTIAKAELWKVGQAKPRDRIRFKPITFDEALALEEAQDAAIDRRAGGAGGDAARGRAKSQADDERVHAGVGGARRARRPAGDRLSASRRPLHSDRIRAERTRSSLSLPRARVDGGIEDQPGARNPGTLARRAIAPGQLR